MEGYYQFTTKLLLWCHLLTATLSINDNYHGGFDLNSIKVN